MIVKVDGLVQMDHSVTIVRGIDHIVVVMMNNVKIVKNR
jgi:hypothetical protein